MMDVGRHPNIELITNAEVEEVSGEEGNFKVKIKKHARYVSEELCNACGDCLKVCPVEVPNEFNEELNTRTAIYRKFAQSVPSTFIIDSRIKSPCRSGCPADVHAQGYVALIAKRKFLEAINLVRMDLPLPSICGRVCTHPCETECRRSEVDEPISICNLKRFIADYEYNNKLREPVEIEPENGHKIAVIGGGPSGLSCAYFLRKAGYSVTIFEAQEKLGGMLRYGIPDYRLPKDMLDYDIEGILELGIEVKNNTKLGKDFTIESLFNGGFESVYISTGAWESYRLTKDKEPEGVYLGTKFLEGTAKGEKFDLGKKVIVIGGGNVAIDAARTIKRMGKNVRLFCLEKRFEMPAIDEEIEDAMEEGIEVNCSWGFFDYITENGRIKGIDLQRCTAVFDENNNFNPVYDCSERMTAEADSIILTIGQFPDVAFRNSDETSKKLEISKRKTIVIDETTTQTNIPGVFAGGDVVVGPATVVEAVGAGKKSAKYIDLYIKGTDLKNIEPEPTNGETSYDELDIRIRDAEKKKRIEPPKLSQKERTNTFKEVVSVFTEEEAVREASRCLNCGPCAACMECFHACQRDAILYDQTDELLEYDVGSVIVATGIDTFNPEPVKAYGYGHYKNVLTQMELERMLSASGPSQGHIYRPSDGKAPESITFIQCVGARGEGGNEYCSRYCCLNTVKDCLLVKQHEPGIKEMNVLYIDLRASGKGFEEFYQRSIESGEIEYTRGRPSKIVEDKQTHDLTIYVEDTQKKELKTIKSDMVILTSTAIPSKGTDKLSRIMGIDLNMYGFFKTKEPNIDSVDSTREGIFLCGCATGPYDIAESVAQATAAASKAGRYVAEYRLPKREIEIEPVDISGPPRIGVFICHCGINIGGVLNIEELVQYVEKLSNVTFVEDNLFLCSDSGQSRIQEVIKEGKINRVVAASCTPRTHEPIFQESCQRAGLNPYLFEMVNIRDQVSWVHTHEPDLALERAKDQIRMAVSKARHLAPLDKRTIKIDQKALIIGGGISGIQCALDLDSQGFEVYLVEKEKTLGGRLKHINTLYPLGISAGEFLNNKLNRINKSKINVMTGCTIKDIKGYIGNFEVETDNGKIKTGTIVLATGSTLYQPGKEYNYDKFENVITNQELELALKDESGLSKEIKTVAFIQCVGSRCKENPTCSRYCCPSTIKQVLELNEKGINTVVFYRDIRTVTPGMEELYKKARKRGVKFIQYDPDNKPDIIGKQKAETVEIYNASLGETIEIPVNMVVLAVAMVPEEVEIGKLQDLIKIPRGLDGFFMERNAKLGPVETTVEGVYVCGCVQSPKDITDSMSQASAAAGKVASLIYTDITEIEPTISIVDERLCRGCGQCVSICEFHAPELVEISPGKIVSKINEALCKGCGTCASWCPTGAITAKHFTDEQIYSMIDSAYKK